MFNTVARFVSKSIADVRAWHRSRRSCPAYRATVRVTNAFADAANWERTVVRDRRLGELTLAQAEDTLRYRVNLALETLDAHERYGLFGDSVAEHCRDVLADPTNRTLFRSLLTHLSH